MAKAQEAESWGTSRNITFFLDLTLSSSETDGPCCHTLAHTPFLIVSFRQKGDNRMLGPVKSQSSPCIPYTRPREVKSLIQGQTRNISLCSLSPAHLWQGLWHCCEERYRQPWWGGLNAPWSRGDGLCRLCVWGPHGSL